MNHMLLVGIGGFIGSVARFVLGGFIMRHTFGWKFPLSTVAINVAGCLIAGVLCGLMETHEAYNAEVRLFLFTGLLGGFTTFSAFGVETIYLLQRQEPGLAALNVLSSVVLGLGALWLGAKIIS